MDGPRANGVSAQADAVADTAGTANGIPKPPARPPRLRVRPVGPALMAVLLVAMMALPSLALTPVEEAPELPAEGPAPCDGDKAEAFEAAHERLLAVYADEPGFVDVLVGSLNAPTGQDTFTVLFDEEARDGPLEAPASFEGFPVDVVSTALLPLPAVEQGLGVQADNLVPSACPQEIRPGARMTAPAGCTFSFVFKGDDDRFYISTAGHCVSQTGQRVNAAGIGEFGTVVYRIDEGLGADFAMIRVDTSKEHLVDPALCHWGGPTSMTSGTSLVVHHYGWGTGFGTVVQTRPRSGVLTVGGSTSASWTGAAAPGDSGSAAITSSGAALVTITHVGIGGLGKTVFGTRVPHGVSLAEDATGREFTLQTAPLKDDSAFLLGPSPLVEPAGPPPAGPALVGPPLAGPPHLATP